MPVDQCKQFPYYYCHRRQRKNSDLMHLFALFFFLLLTLLFNDECRLKLQRSFRNEDRQLLPQMLYIMEQSRLYLQKRLASRMNDGTDRNYTYFVHISVLDDCCYVLILSTSEAYH